MAGLSDLEQSIVNHRKITRTAIRLKYSIAADNEINRVLPIVEARLARMVQQGKIVPMSIDDILLLSGSVE